MQHLYSILWSLNIEGRKQNSVNYWVFIAGVYQVKYVP